VLDLEPPVDFLAPVDLLSEDLEAADFVVAALESADLALADLDVADFIPDLVSDFVPVEAFLPAARAAAVVSAAVFFAAFEGVGFAVLLLVVALVAVLFSEALFSEAPDFILEEASLVLPFVVVAMVSVV